YYGNPTAANEGNPADTWPSEYEAVYHFSDGAGILKDSTVNANNGRAVNSIQSAAAQIASGARIGDGYIEVAGQNLALTGSFTLSAWMKGSDTGDLVSRYYNGFGYFLSSRAQDGVHVGQGTYTLGYRIAGPNVGDNRWHHLAGVYDAS